MSHTDTTLLSKIQEAVTAANEAEKYVTTAQAELVSRSKAIGLLLLEAKKLHPAVKDFEAFLKRVDGLKRSRAYDYLRIAGGRTTDEELRKDARERQKKAREKKKKIPGPTPTPKKSDFRDVTESEKRKPVEQKVFDSPQEAHGENTDPLEAWNEFQWACQRWLPHLMPAHQEPARRLVERLTTKKKAEAA
jgi:hypothetical protein